MALSDVQKISLGETGIKIIPKAQSATQPEYFFTNLMKIKLGEMEPAGVKGDVNGDGVVDIADVNAAIDMILGLKSPTTEADVNGDGTVDVADMNAIINIILGLV